MKKIYDEARETIYFTVYPDHLGDIGFNCPAVNLEDAKEEAVDNGDNVIVLEYKLVAKHTPPSNTEWKREEVK